LSQDRWRKLDVWKRADELAWQVYKLTRHFPKEELYGITSQIRRAALSIPTNIVEGYSRKGDRELGRFLSMSLGSLAEVKYLLHFSQRLGFLAENEQQEIEEGYELLGKSLWRFYEKIQKG
jgi:four helix bundle protein